MGFTVRYVIKIMSGLYKMGLEELAVITPRNTSANALCLHMKTEVCQLLDSEAICMGLKLMGWLQLDGGTQKKITICKKIGQDCITSFCFYCFVYLVLVLVVDVCVLQNELF